MSQKLPLTHGLFALIDDEDFHECSQYRWHVSKRGYVVRNFLKNDGSRTMLILSWFVMNAPAGVNVDHIHGNKLDNRKSELRLCTQQQNTCNRGKNKNNKSGFKGVSWHKEARKWKATIGLNGKTVYLGYFTDIHEAAAEYKSAAEKHYGEFARTENFA